uniref:Huntingtin n=1 Tax=Amazona collaria TaxID=241587 RepID=A0A8B9FLI3_9PSIT
MATMEKLMKAFESLRSFQQQQGPAPPLPSSKPNLKH